MFSWLPNFFFLHTMKPATPPPITTIAMITPMITPLPEPLLAGGVTGTDGSTIVVFIVKVEVPESSTKNEATVSKGFNSMD